MITSGNDENNITKLIYPHGMLRIAVILFLSMVINYQAQAQTNNSELKIGYVNPQSILANMPEMRSPTRLQNFTARKQQELRSRTRFPNSSCRIPTESGVISPEAQQQEEARLGQLQQELLQARAFEQELAQRRDEPGPLLEQIGAAIETVARNQGLSYVLNTTTSSGDMIILYASEDLQQV